MNIKSIFFLGTLSLFSPALVHAQVQTGSPQPTQSSTNFNTTNPASTNPGSGMTQINSSALPDPLRSTLQDNQQYKGWEGGQWYFNSTTNQYSVQMPGTNPGTSGNPTTTTSAPTNPLGSTNPTQGYSTSPITSPQALPANPATASPVNPLSTTPVTGMQLPTSQPAPSGTTSTWYRFDSNGKLIPQPRDN